MQKPFTVGEMMTIDLDYPGLHKSLIALGIAMLREGQADPELPPWHLRLEAEMDLPDNDERDRLARLTEEWNAGESPPLLLDGEPMDLSDFRAPRPHREAVISCGEWSMRQPTLRMLIHAEERDPKGGRLYTYHVLRQAIGCTPERLQEMPVGVFDDLECALAFLARNTIMRIIG